MQKNFVKGIVLIMTEVNKMMGNSGPQNAEDTVGSLMEGVLLLANANQELNYRRRELMGPQINANYRHLCSPSNPVTRKFAGRLRHFFTSLVEYHNRPKYTGHCTALPSGDCLIHSSPSLSLGNLTQPPVLWMHIQLVGIHCIFMPFHLSVKFTDAYKRFWRNKYLRES